MGTRYGNIRSEVSEELKKRMAEARTARLNLKDGFVQLGNKPDPNCKQGMSFHDWPWNETEKEKS